MAKRNYVSRTSVKGCRGCGQPITFARNRNDDRFPVDVLEDEASGRPYYYSDVGAHGNMTPWHKCPFLTSERRYGQAKQEQDREQSMSELHDRYMSRMIELVQAGDRDGYLALQAEFEAEAEKIPA